MRDTDATIVAIGWDVRGWRGAQQAVAVLQLAPGSSTPRWWLSEDFQFRAHAPLNLSTLLAPALGNQVTAIIDRADRIVIGIDAPLAFPQTFVQLLTGSTAVIEPVNTEIENPLAYRDCERWVYKHHGKKPLSASFDKLGNGATLALAMVNGLRPDGFALMPQDAQRSTRAIIEVYPGLHKTEATKASPAIEPVHRLVPESCLPGTDRYDAAVCAISAAVFAGAGARLALPELVTPPANFDAAEGWVYALPAEFVIRHRR